MKLAIMQPYLLPYLGYFQLIHAVDAFVLYDDVNYIKGGWINRNYILGNGDRQLITLPLHGASPNKLINQVNVGGQHKILKTIRQSYGKAPHFNSVYRVLEDIFAQTEKNLARFLDYQLRVICDYLGFSPHWYISSELAKNPRLCGQEKILSICDELGATQYLNLPGGKVLYDQATFARRNLQLSFIHTKTLSYCQFVGGFIPNLSIIDMMMFNNREICTKLLEEYSLD